MRTVVYELRKRIAELRAMPAQRPGKLAQGNVVV